MVEAFPQKFEKVVLAKQDSLSAEADRLQADSVVDKVQAATQIANPPDVDPENIF